MKGIKGIALLHIKNNPVIFLFVVLALILGIIGGSMSVKALNAGQTENLINYLNMFLSKPTAAEINTHFLFRQSLWNNFKIAGLIWILGITIFGIPLVLILLFVKGFIIGFTVGFLVQQLGLRGIIFSTASLFPQNIIILPAMVAMGMSSISFSLMLINRRKTWGKAMLFQQLIGYALCYGLFMLIMLFGVLIEAYITPVFIKSVMAYIS